MRSLIWTGATVTVIAMASGAAIGQTQGQLKHAILITPTPTQVPPIRIAVDPTSVINRILSFDANGDDRIARDELPERMEELIDRGDRDHDNGLTRDEVTALVGKPSSTRRIGRLELRGTLAEIVADLKLAPATHDRAIALVTDHTVPHQINVTTQLDAAMRELLDDEDYENFTASAARLRRTRRVFVGGDRVIIPPPPPR